jgi:hypothetical protein
MVVNNTNVLVNISEMTTLFKSITDDKDYVKSVAENLVVSFNNRTEFINFNIPNDVNFAWIGNLCFERNSSGTAITSNGGAVNWAPYSGSFATPDHFAENTVPGTTDMTAAINAAFAASNNVQFMADIYKFSGSLIKDGGSWRIRGAGRRKTILTTDVDGFHLFKLTSPGDLILQIDFGGFELRYTGGEKLTGAHVYSTARLRSSVVSDLYVKNYRTCFDILAPVKVYFYDIFGNQNGIGSGKGDYLFNFPVKGSTRDKASDVHMHNIQSSGLNDDGNIGLVSHFNFPGLDGVYMNNCHMFNADYAVRFAPTGTVGNDVCASFLASNCYFDNCEKSHISFGGQATAYKSFAFSNCTFRESRGVNGSIVVAPSSGTVDLISVTGGTIRGNTGSGIHEFNSGATNMNISGVMFDGNNTQNSTTSGDVYLIGDGHTVTGTSHSGGGANGYTVRLTSSSKNCQVSGINQRNSTAKSVTDTGTHNVVPLSGGIVIDTTAKTLFDVGEEGAVWEVFIAHAGGTNSAHAVVSGDSATPLIISQSSAGTAAVTFSISGTSLQVVSTGPLTSNWSAKKIVVA